LLAGWLTIATAINVLTALTAKGVPAPTTALAAGVGGIAIVVLLWIVLRVRTPTPADHMGLGGATRRRALPTQILIFRLHSFMEQLWVGSKSLLGMGISTFATIVPH